VSLSNLVHQHACAGEGGVQGGEVALFGSSREPRVSFGGTGFSREEGWFVGVSSAARFE
jgi:hypothetical protein